jgi:hypothetical protein
MFVDSIWLQDVMQFGPWSISARVDVVCLKETKLCHMDRRIVLSMLRADFDNNFIFLLWIGASAGVSVSWRT